MPQIKFTNQVTAFLDILGFTKLTEDACDNDKESLKKFGELLDTLETHVFFDEKMENEAITKTKSAPPEMLPKFIFISDSIILTAPTKFQWDGFLYQGLPIILMKCINISHKLMQIGFLVKGGISLGPTCFHEKNIFGTGYIDAYLTHEKAEMPRILFSESAKTYYDENILNNHIWGPNLGLCRSDGNHYIADTLSPRYWRDDSPIWETQFQKYRQHIVDNLTGLQPGRQRSKWEWMASLYNTVIEENTFAAEPILNTASSKLPSRKI